jgi:hypothetical protein
MKRRLRILELAVRRAEILAKKGIVVDLTETIRYWQIFVEDGIVE